MKIKIFSKTPVYIFWFFVIIDIFILWLFVKYIFSLDILGIILSGIGFIILALITRKLYIKRAHDILEEDVIECEKFEVIQ